MAISTLEEIVSGLGFDTLLRSYSTIDLRNDYKTVVNFWILCYDTGLYRSA